MRVERLIPAFLVLLTAGLLAFLIHSKSRSVAVPVEWEGEPAVTLFYQHECITCHTVQRLPDARGTLGPGLDKVSEVARRLDAESGGKTYLTESILNPSAVVRKGFIDAMPSYEGVLSDLEVEILVEWLLELDDEPDGLSDSIEPVRVLPTKRP